MLARVSHLWRHPIKAHGAEAVSRTSLSAGQTMPWDRVWAIAHEAARLGEDCGAWIPCANFSRGAKSPGLMAIRATMDEATGRITLNHPGAGSITANPDDPQDAAKLVAWAAGLADPNRPKPARVVRASAQGMTDSDFASISILNRASLAELSGRAGRDLDMRRFRGNIWLGGLDPWHEFGLVGQKLTIGGATLLIRERITRCKATMVDPETGERDTDTLGALEAGWGHQDFGVYGEVISSGPVAIGDEARPAA